MNFKGYFAHFQCLFVFAGGGGGGGGGGGRSGIFKAGWKYFLIQKKCS